MPFKNGVTMVLKEETKVRLSSFKGRHTYDDTLNAMMDICEILREALGTKRKDAVTILNKLKEELKEG